MNSKIEISTRVARPSAYVLSLLVLLASACSGSRSALSTEPLGAAPVNASASEKSNLPACGSMTKPCDPNNLGGQTCSTLGAGTGTLMCDPVTCSFDRSMCSLSGTQGGGGLGALLGAFGRAQGGRPAMGMSGMNTGTGMGRGGRGGTAAGGRGGAPGRREDGQSSEPRREEGGSGGEKAEGGEGGSNENTSNAGAGGEAGDSAEQAGAGGEAGESAAGTGGESGAPAPMSAMPAMPM